MSGLFVLPLFIKPPCEAVQLLQRHLGPDIYPNTALSPVQVCPHREGAKRTLPAVNAQRQARHDDGTSRFVSKGELPIAFFPRDGTPPCHRLLYLLLL